MVKSMKVKKVSPIKKQQYDDAKKAVDDFKKAKAVKYDDKERDMIISGKMVERVQLQKKYRLSYLERRVKEDRLRDMRDRIREADEYKHTSVDWMGFSYSINHLKSQYNLEAFELQMLLSNEVYNKQGLMNVGFIEKQLTDILFTSKYVKDHSELQRMEKKYEKKKVKS